MSLLLENQAFTLAQLFAVLHGNGGVFVGHV
jgi:hypothetical protein